MDIKSQIESGQTVLGIELGSTRIKAVLIDMDNKPIASGGHGWENSQVNGIWTYSLDEVWDGIAKAYAGLKMDVEQKFSTGIKSFKAIGFSGMMHGYMVFDKDDKQLVPFRTWRNNITSDAAEKLTETFSYNIPQRWSIAHLYQSVLADEPHVKDIDCITTLAGYIHYRLTGEKVMGVGEASGMFPIKLKTKTFDKEMMQKFDNLLKDKSYSWKLEDIMPKVLVAGEQAGTLTAEGAGLIDSSGELEAGIPLCPPEGDAGTGMVATNSVAVRTGNVSAGTSVFAMLVLEKDLSRVHNEIDLITTPDGQLVGMAHSNNCTSDYDAWISLFGEAAKALGMDVSTPVLYDTLLEQALKGDPDCGGLLAYGYISGEHMTGFSEGRPLFARSEGSSFTLPNFIRTHLFTSLCALKTGLNILIDEEKVDVDEIRGHGGFFKAAEVGQKIMAAATNTPISILETAGEGGAWGIALLASFMVNKSKESLPEYLNKVFAESMGTAVKPDPSDVKGFNAFFERYHKGLSIERAAVETLK
ncbi:MULTISPECIES: xylulokinase [unclassified Oceanispirochaeta]|uniref:xylulokinase n=1 Tax=unclassified Oceanispirochaeta TaxID=2635722 RepID=UPI000E093175|nr:MULTISPECIES: FGGY-family carbohydrate kinase [unclassified Oceanispirochaeta]MBF9018225.1 ATPase [Oceanispirochaeta sp. M2]NPD74669.1 ATPase [Oceanispirochaeta sp. M1]RDG29463.1 ATPase [Oceanispirochaeta sp. M1]